MNTVAWAPPTLLFVTLLVFVLVDLAPGDPALSIAGPEADPEQVEAIRQELDLDRPLLARYGTWISDASTGDLQTSLLTRQEVSTMLGRSLPVTLSLVAVGLTISVIMGFVLGTVPAMFPRQWWLDRLSTLISSLAISMPTFVLALFLVAALAVDYRIFPSIGYVAFTENPGEWLRHLILPALALGLHPAGELARQLRGALQDELESDYVLAQRARGLRRRRIVLRHALRNASIPVVTVLGVRLATMLGATVVIEQLFVIDGIGRVTVQAVVTRDIPVVLGVLLIATTIVLVTNVFIEGVHALLNPRLRAT